MWPVGDVGRLSHPLEPEPGRRLECRAVDAIPVRPIFIGGPPEAQEIAPPIVVGPDLHDIKIVVDGTTYIFTRGELLDGAEPVPVQIFTLVAAARLDRFEG
jgi:hypothetical protein